jgi:NAD(P)-dependent dehydrogenase (short-subunit alcohol dehydrogenase family)
MPNDRNEWEEGKSGSADVSEVDGPKIPPHLSLSVRSRPASIFVHDHEALGHTEDESKGQARKGGQERSPNPKKEIIMNIAQKTVLITGANRGIGRALVQEALQRGAKRVYAGTRGPLDITDERVTPLLLDVTNAAQIQRAVKEVGTLDVLINNAGIALYDDLSVDDSIQQQLAVNLFGPLHVTRTFLPLLKRSKGAIVNNISTVALAALPVVPGYSISKAAALSMTQSLRALLAGQGVTVHAILTGPVDTDMNRGFDIPKASTESAAVAIFDGLEKGEEEIFPDPMSQSIAEGWRNGVAKAMERQVAVFVPESVAL